MSEHIVETFGIVQDFADLHGDMNTPLYEAIMGVMLSRQREEIVRCRDCRWFDDRPNYQLCRRDMSCDEIAVFAEPDGFCAWGTRRGGED